MYLRTGRWEGKVRKLRDIIPWIAEACDGDLRSTSISQQVSLSILTLEDAMNNFDWIHGNKIAAVVGD